jgi:hypothetical protein
MDADHGHWKVHLICTAYKPNSLQLIHLLWIRRGEILEHGHLRQTRFWLIKYDASAILWIFIFHRLSSNTGSCLWFSRLLYIIFPGGKLFSFLTLDLVILVISVQFEASQLPIDLAASAGPTLYYVNVNSWLREAGLMLLCSH